MAVIRITSQMVAKILQIYLSTLMRVDKGFISVSWGLNFQPMSPDHDIASNRTLFNLYLFKSTKSKDFKAVIL